MRSWLNFNDSKLKGNNGIVCRANARLEWWDYSLTAFDWCEKHKWKGFKYCKVWFKPKFFLFFVECLIILKIFFFDSHSVCYLIVKKNVCQMSELLFWKQRWFNILCNMLKRKGSYVHYLVNFLMFKIPINIVEFLRFLRA